MNEPLTLERFRELADAYGAVVARWPEVYRDAALQMAQSVPARAIIADASSLDATLDTWGAPALSAELRDRIVAVAPVRAGRFARPSRLWWSGIGIAAALSGAVAGSAAVAMVAPVDASDGGTSFGDVATQDS